LHHADASRNGPEPRAHFGDTRRVNPDGPSADALVARWNVRTLDATDPAHDLVLTAQLDAITALIEVVDNDPGGPDEH